jgi:hypothetical protein
MGLCWVTVNWTGLRFQYVRVKRNGKELIMPLRQVLHDGRKGKLTGDMTIWSQPQGADGKLIPVYYGNMVFRFLGDKKAPWDELPTLPSVVELTRRLKGLGISPGKIRVGLAKRDLYVFVSPSWVGLDKPHERFPRLCAGVAKKLAQGLPYDPTIYDAHVMIPIPQSRLDDGSYFKVYSTSEIDQPCASIMLTAAKDERGWGGWKTLPNNNPQPPALEEKYSPLKAQARDYDPLLNPSKAGILAKLPEDIRKVLNYRLPDNLLEPLCFGIGLAVKSLGASEDDAMAIIDTAIEIDRLDRTKRRAAVDRAFTKPYQYGARSFAKAFCDYVPAIPDERSKIIRFRRDWLKNLLSSKAPYQAHVVMYQLLLEYHDYPRPWLPIPDGWPVMQLRKALKSLVANGIIEIKQERRRRQINLIDKEKLGNNYVQSDEKYLKLAVQCQEEVKLFSALLASSRNMKNGMHHTRASIETLAKNMGASLRTARTYLYKLREQGFEISTDLQLPIKYCKAKMAENA